ncbi:hypothetical protein [Gordonia westfalica]|uniref:hypothetical protein n=1 Tax=Gordonia westfalica TaxID=158898 RepID=UPI000AE721E9|nr:hypothetical protein [Gordonia westfalica]
MPRRSARRDHLAPASPPHIMFEGYWRRPGATPAETLVTHRDIKVAAIFVDGRR